MYKVLQSALVEKDVENAYRNALREAFSISAQITSPHGTDGLLTSNYYKGDELNLIMLLECKFNTDFTKNIEIIKVLVQALYYLKKFEDYGDDLPNVILVGDKNECFCLHSNDIKDYLSEELDWTIPPSSAALKNPKLIKKMMADESVAPYVFKVNKDFDFDAVIEKAIELSKEQVNFVRITEKNIDRVFNDFVANVLFHKKITKDLANKLVNVFLSVLINPEENYLHPKKPQTLVTKDLGNIRVDRNKFVAFFRHFQKDYSPKEKDNLAAICDRLIEDTTRRFQGEFFTPTPWVLEAHKMIEEQFGPDWKEEYVVWDPAWGTGNLTRDFKFKELYVSTLNASDIGIAEQRGYNPEAVKFQFDFLNDPYEKLPQGLRDAIESGRKILVLMNPPYGTSSNLKQGTSKKGVAVSLIHSEMAKFKLGDARKQLYAQFLFRLKALTDTFDSNISIGIYSNISFITGQKFKNFRGNFFSSFEFKAGILFEARHFSNVVKGWAISFTLWSRGRHNNNFLCVLKGLDNKGKVVALESKTLYNTDNLETLNKWARKETYGLKQEDLPQLSTAINVKPTGYGRMVPGSLGYAWSCKNIPEANGLSVGIFSSPFSGSNSNGYSIFDFNIDKTVALFAARKSISSDWRNHKDEYLAPNTEHPDYKQWNRDCLVYSLFNNSSNQSSLRNIEYKGKTWNIENQWFWMANEEMMNLANTSGFDALYQDARNFSGERFIYHRLQELQLSDDADDILQKAEMLVIDSMEYREILHQEHPEYHLNTWDAGWYQIKLILKEFMPERLKTFRADYKKFEDRMREGVYKFGFLK
jgi:hypothetical protein